MCLSSRAPSTEKKKKKKVTHGKRNLKHKWIFFSDRIPTGKLKEIIKSLPKRKLFYNILCLLIFFFTYIFFSFLFYFSRENHRKAYLNKMCVIWIVLEIPMQLITLVKLFQILKRHGFVNCDAFLTRLHQQSNYFPFFKSRFYLADLLVYLIFKKK